MKADENIWFSIHTPGGLIVRLDWEDTPEPIQKLFRKVEDTRRCVEERAVASLSRFTGCSCTLHRSSQLTCSANYSLVDTKSNKE